MEKDPDCIIAADVLLYHMLYECCIYLDTLPQVLYFVHTSKGGAVK